MRQIQLILFIALFGLGACQADQASKTESPSVSSQSDPLPSAPPPSEPKPLVDSLAKDTTPPVTKAEKPKLSPPQMEFDTLVYDFGTIESGDVVKYEFKFRNLGDRPLEINNIIGSCGCTAASIPFLPFPKGDEGSIQARFDSKGKIGKQENTLTIKSNNGTGDVVLTIKGVVKDKEE